MRTIAVATVMLCIAMCFYAPWTAQRVPLVLHPSTGLDATYSARADALSPAMDEQAIAGTTVFVNRPAWAAPAWTDGSDSYTGELDRQLLFDAIVAILTAGAGTVGGAVAYRRWAEGFVDPWDVWREQ